MRYDGAPFPIGRSLTPRAPPAPGPAPLRAAPQPDLSPFAPAAAAAPAAPAPEVEEFDLNKMADFLPAESNPDELTGALQEAGLEEAFAVPPREPDVSNRSVDLTEPRPLDVLTPRVTDLRE